VVINTDDTDENNTKADNRILLSIRRYSGIYLAIDHIDHLAFVVDKSDLYFRQIIRKITHLIRNLVK